MDESKTIFWASRYAALISIEKNRFLQSSDICKILLTMQRNDSHRFIRIKSKDLLDSINSTFNQ